ncbi:hypothetical protein C5167_044133 [Papaver somniferum]|uniref:STM1-like N-terminal domain-containing protein n=1 Tax=Papaver somniferum TaxID=3469 RepID=A0A4Y7LBA7_PAPSO|nr:RGG repeats nuclear RNA binding protein C-like [Papaver somniferum]RZC81571.1 hypothetical protein C5167_044133 [Papaver somniferum]
MVTMNSFDLLGDVDNEDPSQLLELLQQKIKSKKLSSVVPDADEVSAAAKFPSHAVKERREGYSGPRDGERGGTGRGRGGRGSGFGGRNSYSNESSDGYTPNDSELEKDSRNGFDREHGMRHGPGPYRPIRGGVNTWGDPFDGGNRDRRISNRWAGSRKHGNSATAHDQPEEKHEDLVAEMKEIISDEVEQSDAAASEAINDWEESKTNEEKEAETKKAEEEAKKAEEEASKRAEEEAKRAEEEAKRAEEEKKMTLEEYEKVLEEKRKVLVAMKAEERKVELDKSFESMKLLKKGEEEIFVKLGSDKNSGKRREDGYREEKVKKSVSIIEFLKPAEGERRNYRSGGGRRDSGEGGRGATGGGRGATGGGRRDRGEGDRGATRGRGGGQNNNNARSSPDGPSIGDISLFPSLGGK